MDFRAFYRVGDGGGRRVLFRTACFFYVWAGNFFAGRISGLFGDPKSFIVYETRTVDYFLGQTSPLQFNIIRDEDKIS